MKNSNDKIEIKLNCDTEVSVDAYIAPIAYTKNNSHIEWDALAKLSVAHHQKQYPTSVFQSFLPSKPAAIGDLWQIQKDGALKLLRQLHPDPRIDMHIDIGDSSGLWACLRAYNHQFADILFRVHAEFALEDGWFTPSQFAGRLIINRFKKTITFFEMCVPEGILNFDINWKKHKDRSGYSTDIGFCPQIQLSAKIQTPEPEFIQSITPSAAEHALRRCFYKSQHIDWVPLHQALKMAQEHQKPIHAISVNGPLADESC